MKNAVERVLEHRQVVERYGERIHKIREAMLAKHKLDFEKDAPIPQWAIEILKDPHVGYRTRIKMVMTHQYDITDENPSWRFVQPSEMRDAPEKPPPKELVEFREAKRKQAEEYISRINKGEGK